MGDQIWVLTLLLASFTVHQVTQVFWHCLFFKESSHLMKLLGLHKKIKKHSTPCKYLQMLNNQRCIWLLLQYNILLGHSLLHAHMQIHKYITTGKKNQHSQLYTKQKNYGGASVYHVFKHPFSSNQEVKTFLILSNMQTMYKSYPYMWEE